MLPLIVLGAGALVSTLFGAKKGLDGLIAQDEAGKTSASARLRLAAAQDRLRGSRQGMEAAAAALDVSRAAAATVISQTAVPQLNRVSDIVDEGRTFGTSPRGYHYLEEPYIDEIGSMLPSIGSGAILGRLAGGGLSGAATAAATQFGVASTGAAISGLSGAAAQNATLAYLGGGSLAAGGFGMAGGAAVLGGVTIGPAVMIAGLRYASKAEDQLVAAQRYSADVAIGAARADEAIARIKAIGRRAKEVRGVIEALTFRTSALSEEVRRALDSCDAPDQMDFDALAPVTKAALVSLLHLVITLDSLISLELHNEAGEGTENWDDVLAAGRAKMEDQPE